MAIKIVPIEDQEGFWACERLQQEIWGFAELAIIPDHLMIVASKNGGLLLGAYDDERSKLVGFAFSLLGLEGGRLRHWSLMTGVLPEVRYRGVGYQLKLAQREHVLAQGIELIAWTYDPLQSANAHFNFAKLGVLAQKYERDFYGEMRDRLNRGLPSDRLLVEWWLRSPRVEAKLARRYRLPRMEELLAGGGVEEDEGEGEGSVALVNRTELREGWLVNVEYELDLEAERLLIEVPTDTPMMRERAMELARRWREETREIFEGYLGRGYLVSEFFTTAEGGRRRGYYLLERVPPEEVLQREGVQLTEMTR